MSTSTRHFLTWNNGSRPLILGMMAIGLLISVFVAALFGRLPFTTQQVFKAILQGLGVPWCTDGIDTTCKVVVFDVRLSRIVLSSMVGMSLATAGACFQGILRNPLADPFTIGVATGAAFGASVVIFLGIEVHALLTGIGLLPLAAFAGAMAALFVVIMLSRVDGYLRRDTMVLAGIVVATFLSALISLLKSLDEESVSSIVFWVMGSFQGRGWHQVLFCLPYMVIGHLILWLHSRELDLLSLGQIQARQLGVDVSVVRLRLLVGASLLTAASVSVSGVIGFVGLVVPHLIRLLIGAEHRPLLLLSGLLGATVLLWSDVLARTILPGGEELPVGVVTALFGGPFFCLLLRRRKGIGMVS